MAKIDVRAELLKATSLVMKKGETEVAFAQRVAEYISDKMSDDDYGKLSKEAQNWYEKVGKAVEDEKEIPPLPAEASAAPTPAAKKAAAAPAPAAKKAAPAKKAAAPAPAKKAAPAKKEAEAEEDREPRLSVSDLVKVLVCKNPKLTKEQVKTKLDEGGHELADAQLRNVYANTQRVITILTELGWAKGPKA